MKSKKTSQLNVWWAQGLMFVVFTALGYGFISLALDSAKTLEYVLGIVFLIWAVKALIKSVRLAVGRG